LVMDLSGITITKHVTPKTTVYSHSFEPVGLSLEEGDSCTLLEPANNLSSTLEREYRTRRRQHAILLEAHTPVSCFQLPEVGEGENQPYDNYDLNLTKHVQMALVDVGPHYGKLPAPLMTRLHADGIWSVMIIALTSQSSSDPQMEDYLRIVRKQKLDCVFVALQPIPKAEFEQLEDWLVDLDFPHPEISLLTVTEGDDGCTINSDDLRVLEQGVERFIDRRISDIVEPLRAIIEGVLDTIQDVITETTRTLEGWVFAEKLHTTLHELVGLAAMEIDWEEGSVRYPGGPFATPKDAKETSLACAQDTQLWSLAMTRRAANLQTQQLLGKLNDFYELLNNIPGHPERNGGVTAPMTRNFEVNVREGWYHHPDHMVPTFFEDTPQYHVKEHFGRCVDKLHQFLCQRVQEHLGEIMVLNYAAWCHDLNHKFQMNQEWEPHGDGYDSLLLDLLENLVPVSHTEDQLHELQQRLENMKSFQLALESLRGVEGYSNLFHDFDSIVRFDDSVVEVCITE